tara:strand:- start:21 stop:221 length:201 start_codon:yes stop_codon:yes gene_type:complete
MITITVNCDSDTIDIISDNGKTYYTGVCKQPVQVIDILNQVLNILEDELITLEKINEGRTTIVREW